MKVSSKAKTARLPMAESKKHSLCRFIDALIVGAPFWRMHDKGQEFWRMLAWMTPNQFYLHGLAVLEAVRSMLVAVESCLIEPGQLVETQ
jgi:hypothetical protein